MRVDEFDFDLPEERIALRPAVPRDAARLLVVRPDAGVELVDAQVSALGEHLAPGDVLVFNDTRVIPARLTGRRLGRGGYEPVVEATLIERRDEASWIALAKPGRKLQPGDRLRFGADPTVCEAETLDATVEAKGDNGEVTLAFDVAGPFLDERLKLFGVMPLPPYIAARRPVDERDHLDYQTVFARREGAVAAPTAGLHFTDTLFAKLDERGIGRAFVTLEVGAGTFLPVKAEDTAEHRMHSERGEIDAATAERLNGARAAGHRIVAVGTTSLRLLESAADVDGTIRPFSGATDLFVTPGYRFRVVDVLMTNFHLPRSTLFMLVSAFCGLDRMKRAYAHAVAAGYRFYSYGDACLLFPDRSLWVRPVL
ncbi:tRNA preQ1(34) S-adenosylmethionine ribosyltransferase-isomerase QueA [Rhodoligotrophos defluvii]|uniref:tRNA preQ1(34) S-adenosylmethionine ribosyltransferase-isomerase QueA n=1 Tax=Rhodoligotrophos defluvii TaxID=2561934 RepID=UPI0010C99EEC|nr:tRNA preQ1(34) S-adenosylmethionine ribosyltransferase-isomerase QueA [Rhodoligotrophos defluvii]